MVYDILQQMIIGLGESAGHYEFEHESRVVGERVV